MAAESLEIRMARLEGAYEQVDKRLGSIESGLRDLRAEMVGEFANVRGELTGVRGEFASLRQEIDTKTGGLRQEIEDLRGDMRQQFYWVIGLLVVSYLVPIALRFLPP